MIRSLALLSLLMIGCAPGAEGGDCTATWTGAVSGSGACDGSAWDKLLAFAGGTPTTLNWIVTAESATHDLSFQYQIPNPPDANSYSGGTTADQYCAVNLIPKTAGTTGYTALSRPSPGSGSPARGSCQITFSSKTNDSSASTIRYLVHGTAQATAVAGSDGLTETDVTVTF